jgi:hypothetical protein
MSWVAVGTAVVGAVGTAYSASQAGEGAPAPVQSNPGADLMKYLKGLNKGLPLLEQMESQYRPRFGELNIADQEQYLNALLGMGGQAAGTAQQQLAAQRKSEFADIGSNVGTVQGILGQLDPTGMRMLNQTSAMADQRFQAAQGLNMQENRMAEQGARESFAARGRLGDTAGVAAEILGREEVLANKRAEALGIGQQAFGMSQQVMSPALQMLMGAPAGLALGQDYLNRSAAAIGQNQPQFINPDAGINLGQQNAANMNAYMQAQAAAKQNQAAMYGQMGTSLMNLAGTMYQNR